MTRYATTPCPDCHAPTMLAPTRDGMTVRLDPESDCYVPVRDGDGGCVWLPDREVRVRHRCGRGRA